MTPIDRQLALPRTTSLPTRINLVTVVLLAKMTDTCPYEPANTLLLTYPFPSGVQEYQESDLKNNHYHLLPPTPSPSSPLIHNLPPRLLSRRVIT